MNRIYLTVLGVLVLVFLFGVYLLVSESNPEETDLETANGESEKVDSNDGNDDSGYTASQEQLIQCLDEKNVVIYGSATCPYCRELVNSLGGYEMVDPIYVECSLYSSRCTDEMQTTGVPEIQIDGVLYQGSRAPSDIASQAGCTFGS